MKQSNEVLIFTYFHCYKLQLEITEKVTRDLTSYPKIKHFDYIPPYQLINDFNLDLSTYIMNNLFGIP